MTGTEEIAEHPTCQLGRGMLLLGGLLEEPQSDQTFALVTHQIHSECLKVSGLPVLTQHCADYLNYLAFARYKLTQAPRLMA
jgi:hypothetical protein